MMTDREEPPMDSSSEEAEQRALELAPCTR
jgi:hypothetical protein